MLNAVCEPSGIGAAVLIRALEPFDGIDEMYSRRGVTRESDLCSGPGKLTQALDIRLSHNGCDLSRGPVAILPREPAWHEPKVLEGTRIGITKAVELPWRFCVAGNDSVSRPRVSER
jgi:DNA-3-methyladenine glycosylase